MGKRLSCVLSVALALLALAGCAPGESGPRTLYVDGTRGCKQPAVEVALWALPGAGAVGSAEVGVVPHGTPFAVLEETTVYGIRFYRLEDQGVQGWLPETYVETIPPVCDD
jgi:hypothetical protein